MPQATDDMAMKFLVIEDNNDIRNGIVQMLEDASYLVDAVESGLDGIYRALNWEYDAIILDVMLPEKNGWEVLEAVRKEKTTPILMLTALGDLDNRLRGLDNGADDYLTKPYEPKELLARLRVLVRRSSGLANNIIEIGNVSINLANKTVLRDDQDIQLTKSQYLILVHLAKQAGSVVSPSDLEDAVSDDENSNFSNVLDVQIYHIRRKLGKEFILNQRGHGYYIPAR